ncbi:MAG TPA: DegT/DnrJ/EryC1/StrS family aminotransferase [Gemmatimonadales bacterium]|nr:DegT/DnrJ/EryC1/StrS family aminotransferase [Gemmatimonadales bacterium]
MVSGADEPLIRLARPDIDDADIAAVAEVLRSGFLVQGPQVQAFESRIAEMAGAAHGVAVANCTAALQLALLVLDVGPGDAVAVGAYSWPASANVIALVGAEPVFVDIDPVSWTMRPDALKTALATHPHVKAVMPVHVFGAMADLPAICALAESRRLPVVEDAACALGASLAGRPAGGWGRVGCFSFHPRKSVTTGEGGVLVTSDPAVARRARALRNHGLDPDAAAPDFILPGYNLRLTEMQGALGVSQLRKFTRLLDRRREVAGWYAEALAGSDVTLQGAPAPEAHAYQAYVVLLPRGVQRDSAIAALRQAGIETTIGTHHQPLTSWFRTRGRHRPGDFPVTDDVAARALALPLHSALTRRDVDRVARALTQVLRGPR